MEKWQCPDCDYKSSIDENRCISCGYISTAYDLASAAEDTGQYLIETLSIETDNLEVHGPGWFKIALAITIGIGIGIAVIALLKSLL